jgi:hypothetical protein
MPVKIRRNGLRSVTSELLGAVIAFAIGDPPGFLDATLKYALRMSLSPVVWQFNPKTDFSIGKTTMREHPPPPPDCRGWQKWGWLAGQREVRSSVTPSRMVEQVENIDSFRY